MWPFCLECLDHRREDLIYAFVLRTYSLAPEQPGKKMTRLENLTVTEPQVWFGYLAFCLENVGINPAVFTSLSKRVLQVSLPNKLVKCVYCVVKARTKHPLKLW